MAHGASSCPLGLAPVPVARKRITVVIPTHNRRAHVLVAIASAQRQTRPAEEIIVVADGCTDGTAEAVRAIDDKRVTLLHLPKAPATAGSTATRRFARRAAKDRLPRRPRLRAEISRVGLRFEADTRHDLYRRNDQHAELHERFGEALAELERLRRQEGRLS